MIRFLRNWLQWATGGRDADPLAYERDDRDLDAVDDDGDAEIVTETRDVPADPSEHGPADVDELVITRKLRRGGQAGARVADEAEVMHGVGAFAVGEDTVEDLEDWR